MILRPHPDGLVAVAQSAHALVAFQLADHWGNRLTQRPSPRAEVLAAVLLHDAGWDGNEQPRLAADGRPVAFDTLPHEERERVWGAAVERAAARGRYVAYLVSHHVSTLAEMGGGHSHAAFLSRQRSLREAWRADLARDPRYAEVLDGERDEINRAVVRLTDAVAVHLVAGTAGPVRLAAVPRRGGSTPLTVTKVDEQTHRLRPWPLVGRRLDVSTEGRLLAAARFSDQGSLTRAWAAARTVRLSWTLLAPGTAAD